jgi:probable rRNA maturation factor
VSAAVEISIASAGWARLPDAEAVVRRAAAAALADAGVGDSELGVTLTDDARMRELNRVWRGADRPTNVLSFPAPQAKGAAPRLLGDVVIAYETVLREAAELRIPPCDHLAHLVVHGLLHLLGHDHENDRDADVMENLERAILARLGVPDPYPTREPAI